MSIDCWKRCVSTGPNSVASSFRTLGWSPSGPKALEGFKPLRSLVTTSLETAMSSTEGADLSRSGAWLSSFLLNSSVNWPLNSCTFSRSDWATPFPFLRAPAAQRQMRKKISFGPTFFHLAQTFGAYFFRRHFYFFLCYKRYELRKRLMTPNKQCRWRVFLNWWWPLVIIGYKVRPIIDTYLVDWTWCLFN